LGDESLNSLALICEQSPSTEQVSFAQNEFDLA
jgi:hypothetical protein